MILIGSGEEGLGCMGGYFAVGILGLKRGRCRLIGGEFRRGCT